MSNDITGVLHELRAAYRAYQSAKRDHKERIREKYETVIADEVRKAVESEKYNFSSLLRDRKERFSLRVTDIQDHVLRTRNWKVWEELRDYADIQPEQVTRDNAREEAKRPYRFEKFTYRGTERDAILWLKDKKGKTLDTALRAYVVWDFLDFPDLDRDQEDYRKSVGYGFEEFTRLTGAIIKEHYEGKEQGE